MHRVVQNLVCNTLRNTVLFNSLILKYSPVSLVTKFLLLIKVNRFLEITAKTKWRGLRDQFLKELKRIPVPESGDPQQRIDNYRGKWQYFEKLSFLEEIAGLHGRSLETSDIDDSTYRQEKQSAALGNIKDEHEQYIKTETPLYKKQGREVDSDSSLDTELLKMGHSSFQLETEDEDLLFFKSLLPYFKQLDPIQKLRIRNQFQDILIQNLSTQQQVPSPEYKLFS